MLDFFQWNEAKIFTFFFVLTRVTSLLVFLPIFGDKVIPGTVKVLFGVALAAVVYPVAWSRGTRVDLAVADSSLRLTWAIVSDIGFGMMVGFVARWIFDAAQFAGYFAGTTMGFSMASVLDPTGDSQTIALSQLQYLLTAMLFLALDGHHLYLSVILESFRMVPLAGVKLLANGDGIVRYMIDMTAEVIVLGLKLSAPVLVVILLVNLTFGVLARAVPQMNVLAVSFSVNIVVGLFIALVSLPGFVNLVGAAFESYTPELLRFMRLFGG